MRILITGGRSWADEETIANAILDLKNWYPFDWEDVVIVHGDCPTGADAMAQKFAEESDLITERYPAEWSKYGRAAGPQRNQKMVDLGADVVLAFIMPGSRGTADCVKRAKKAGLTVKEFQA